MHIRVTTDPISLNDVNDPENHPCIYQGDGNNGLEIYFETESNRDQFLSWEHDHENDEMIILRGDDSDDYIAEG